MSQSLDYLVNIVVECGMNVEQNADIANYMLQSSKIVHWMKILQVAKDRGEKAEASKMLAYEILPVLIKDEVGIEIWNRAKRFHNEDQIDDETLIRRSLYNASTVNKRNLQREHQEENEILLKKIKNIMESLILGMISLEVKGLDILEMLINRDKAATLIRDIQMSSSQER